MTLDLAAAAKKRGIRYFLIPHADLFGTLRAKLVPTAAIGGMARAGAGFAGFSTWLDMSPADADMQGIPDANSLIQLPWKPEVGWLAADLWMGGSPFPQAPRVVLRRQMEAAAAQGLTLKTGVECEFFLLDPGTNLVADAADRAEKPAYDQIALMRRYGIVSEICDAMQALGWEPYQNDHEDANGQFEMIWELCGRSDHCGPARIFFKYMVKSIAEKRGLRATFMPKPFAHLTGSGCHAHVSSWRSGRNLLEAPSDELGISATCRHFMGGVLRYAEALTALTNPAVNSYKRINGTVTQSGAAWSPNTITWSGNNRTHMLRIPDAGRFEFRLADGAVNPYLLQAGLLAAGLDGLVSEADPGPRLDIDMYTDGHTVDARRLPLNLLDALRAFEANGTLRAALGDAFVSAYLWLKYRDWASYTRHLSAWELETTLDI